LLFFFIEDFQARLFTSCMKHVYKNHIFLRYLKRIIKIPSPGEKNKIDFTGKQLKNAFNFINLFIQK